MRHVWLFRCLWIHCSIFNKKCRLDCIAEYNETHGYRPCYPCYTGNRIRTTSYYGVQRIHSYRKPSLTAGWECRVEVSKKCVRLASEWVVCYFDSLTRSRSGDFWWQDYGSERGSEEAKESTSEIVSVDPWWRLLEPDDMWGSVSRREVTSSTQSSSAVLWLLFFTHRPLPMITLLQISQTPIWSEDPH